MKAPQPPRQRHRAVVTLALIVLGLAWLALTIPAPSRIDGRSLIALLAAVLLAAVGGIAFSWKRYFGRK